jgi:glycosyltransferase involved in cell wall biosynthesis
MQSSRVDLISYLAAGAKRSKIIAVATILPETLRSQFRCLHVDVGLEAVPNKLESIEIVNLDNADLSEFAGPDCIVVCQTIDTLKKSAKLRIVSAVAQWFEKNALIIHFTPQKYQHDADRKNFDSFAQQLGFPPLHVGLLPAGGDEEQPQMVALYDREVQEAIKTSVEAFPPPLAIVSSFNEEDIIKDVVEDIIEQGCELVVLDNWSTDGTWEILQSLQNSVPSQLSIERFPSKPVAQSSWRDILARKEEIALQHKGRWILHSDADELRRSPFPGVNLARAMQIAQATGATRIDFTVLNFRPVDAGPYIPGTLKSAFKYFQFGTHPSYFQQRKAWLQGNDRVDLRNSGGHDANFGNAADFRYKFWLKHYPIRSMSHGRVKTYRERAQRWSTAEKEAGWHVHYDDVAGDSSFVWPAEQLLNYHKDTFYKKYGLTVMTNIAERLYNRPSAAAAQSLSWYAQAANDHQDKLTEAERRITDIRSQIEARAELLTDAERRVKDINSQIEAWAGVHAEAERRISAREADRASLEAQLAELQKIFAVKIEQFDRELGTRETKIKALSDQSTVLEADRASIKAQHAELQKLFAEKIGEFDLELGTREAKIKALSDQNTVLEADRASIKAQLADLQKLLAVKTEQFDRELGTRETKTKALLDQNTVLEADRASIKAQLADLQKLFAEKSEEFDRELGVREMKFWALSDQNRVLETDSASIKAQLAALQKLFAEKTEQFDRELGARDDQIKIANEETLRFYQSWSWRLTSPLRAVRRYFAAVRAWAIASGVRLYRISPPFAKKRIRSTLLTNAPALVRSALSDHPQQHPRDTSVVSVQHAFVAEDSSPVSICRLPLQIIPPARIIAFYLPQFHPIPENDQFWGEGFTEWTNVRRGTPQFAGHYQPRLPGELGYYDLRLVEVQRRQVELAKLYGIGGFCFYFYWFNGRVLLEAPLKQYLANGDLELPFCLCWANENWTRTWDGASEEVLIEQHHTAQDDLAVIRHLAQYIADPRYIRINGKPLVVVYRPSLLPAASKTAERWRSWCREQGLGEIYLAYVQSFESVDPAKYGFDAAIEFPPNNMHCPLYSGKLSDQNPLFSGLVFDWEFFVRQSERYQLPRYVLFRGVNPSWDNEARRPGHGTIMLGSSPERYRYWLENALRDTVARFDDPSERLVFVNAWNEWAEGAYLEPDNRYGFAYLQATRAAIGHVALERPPTDAIIRSRSGIIVIGHDAHPHGAQFLAVNIMRELRQALGFDAECLLLRGGSLTSDYARIGPTQELHGCGPESPEAINMIESLRRRGFHTAFCNTTAAGHFAPMLKKAGFRVISLIHELPQVLENYEGVGLKKHAESIAAASDVIIFPGELVANGFRKFAPFHRTKQTILSQGLYKRNRFRAAIEIDRARAKLRKQLGLASDTRIVLSVAFGDRRKGIDLFVDIGERLLAEMPNTVFIWAGHLDAEIKEEITRRIAHSVYAKHFIFPGFISDTDPFFAGADLYALTSREDPFPTVILESLEVGVPVVAFEGVGAFEQAFRTHGVGRLAAPFDTEIFAQELKNLLKDEARRIAMGRNGAELVKREFSFRKYVYDLMAIAQIPVKRVSVVVPNYNYRRYLEARLHSISNQTIAPYEIIVIDDASTDESREWLEENLERLCPGAQFFTNELNSGSAFSQWLSGVRRARGEYVWIAEADDVAEPDFLAEVIAKFDEPDVVLSYCQSKQMNSDGKILCDHYLDYVKDISPTKWTEPYVNSGVDEIVSALSIKNTIPNVSAAIFKRDILLAVLEDKAAELAQYRVAGDWVTYVEVLRRGKVAFSPRSLNLHRRHVTGVTMSSFNFSQLKEIMSVQQKVREEFKPPDVITERASSYSEKLFQQFGLASSDAPSVRQHSELGKLI